MQSTVHLFNTALGRLGGEQLSLNRSPLEEGTSGQLCENLFPHVLDLALSVHAWSFATRRAVLARPQLEEEKGERDNPAYPLAFALPPDCLKPLRLEGNAWVNRQGPAYVLEGRTIRCAVEGAELVYVARVEDPLLWPPAFADALAWALAAELSPARNNDPQKQAWCLQNYKIALSEAIARDCAGQNPRPPRSVWKTTRFGGAAYAGE
jgi:hypothetical protein